MTIQTRDQFWNALANNSSRLIIDKVSISNAAAGQFESLWRANGQPGQGAIPGSAAACTNATTGALGFTQQTAPATSYLGILEGYCANAGTTLEIHDRLVTSGNMVGNVATAQNGFDLSTFLASNNIDARKGDANYSDVQWWLEWYTDTGSTAVTATVNALFNDASSANLTAISLAATRRAALMIPLNGLVGSAQAGKFIQGINNVTLSVSTGTAGAFGVTATRYRAAMYKPVANARFTQNALDLGLPEIANSSCLMAIQLASTTTTGIVRATGKIVHG